MGRIEAAIGYYERFLEVGDERYAGLKAEVKGHLNELRGGEKR